MSVEIVNTTTVPVKISEGSAGVFHEIAVIHPDKPFKLRVDMNMTYREYLLTTVPENLPVGSSLTSDDVIEYSEVEIKEEIIGDCPIWFGTPKAKRRGVFRFFERESPEIQIVNGLEDQDIEIERKDGKRKEDGPLTVDKPEPNEPADRPETDDRPQTNDEPKERTVDRIAPGKPYSLSVLPDRSYSLRTSPTNKELACWSSNQLKLYSQIEVNIRKEYSWKGIPLQEGSSVSN